MCARTGKIVYGICDTVFYRVKPPLYVDFYVFYKAVGLQVVYVSQSIVYAIYYFYLGFLVSHSGSEMWGEISVAIAMDILIHMYPSVPVLQSGMKVYRYNRERTLEWLKTKVSS